MKLDRNMGISYILAMVIIIIFQTFNNLAECVKPTVFELCISHMIMWYLINANCEEE